MTTTALTTVVPLLLVLLLLLQAETLRSRALWMAATDQRWAKSGQLNQEIIPW